MSIQLNADLIRVTDLNNDKFLSDSFFHMEDFNSPIAMKAQPFDLPMLCSLTSEKCKVGGSITEGKHFKDKQWGCNPQLSFQLTGCENPTVIKYPIISDE